MFPTTDRPAVSPELGPITRTNGIAGQYAYSVPVTYPGETTKTVTFTGSSAGQPGPVVMIDGATGAQTFVTDPDRFGSRLTAEWVRSFYA